MPGAERIVPSPDVLRAARRGSAVVGALGVTFAFLLVRRLFGPGAAWIAAFLLAASPLWLPASRRAMTDVHGIAFSLGAIWLTLRARTAWLDGSVTGRVVLAFASAGILCGLAVGAKFNVALIPVALALFVGVEAVVGWRRRERPVVALLGVVAMTAAAVAVFLGTYPYLWPDPIGRLAVVMDDWEAVRTTLVKSQVGLYAEAYPPGWRSLTEMLSVLVLPGAVARVLLLLPVGVAVALRAGRDSGLSSPQRTLIVWLAFLPAAITAALEPGRLADLWIGWTGLVVGALVWLGGGPSARLEPPRGSVLLFAVVALAATAFVIATTHITWPRYYLPALPFLIVLAALGLDTMRRTARQCGGRTAEWLVLGAIAAGCASILPTYPQIGQAAKNLAAADPGLAPRFLGASVVLLSAAAVVAARRSFAPRRP